MTLRRCVCSCPSYSSRHPEHTCNLCCALLQYLDSVRDDAEEEDDFMANIEKNTRRYHKIFSKAVDDILPAPTDASLPSDIFDVLATQVDCLAIFDRLDPCCAAHCAVAWWH